MTNRRRAAGLRRHPEDDDASTRRDAAARALAALARDADTTALSRDAASVRLLWEVCQVPDFQGVLTEAHTRLLARVFAFLRGPSGRIPEDFLHAHVRELDRTDGEVDVLLGRIAAIRTWTYLSNRTGWVPDAGHWQERTRAVEDRLSDALHEKLTQEFVDRPGTVIARHEASELVTTIGADGEVLVQGLRAGVLEGFRFRPERGHPRLASGASCLPRSRSRSTWRYREFTTGHLICSDRCRRPAICCRHHGRFCNAAAANR